MPLPFESVQRKILIKKDSVGHLGKHVSERSTEEIIHYGIINLDKPAGPTSHQACEYVKNIFKLSKAGHSGTLDPNVTGVLPVALGRATRIVQIVLPAGKEYIALMHLHQPVEEKQLMKVLADFTGAIRQKPPLKSAVRRVERTRTIYYLEILEIQEQDILFRVGCQAGTYIRKLCHDIGKKLGIGAHMQELRRTKAGPFDESTTYSLQDITDAFWYYTNKQQDTFLRKIIQPVENALQHMLCVWVLDNCVGSLLHGIDLKVPGISKLHDGICKEMTVAVKTLKEELVAIGTARMSSKEIMDQENGVAVNIHKVFMQT